MYAVGSSRLLIYNGNAYPQNASEIHVGITINARNTTNIPISFALTEISTLSVLPYAPASFFSVIGKTAAAIVKTAETRSTALYPIISASTVPNATPHIIPA